MSVEVISILVLVGIFVIATVRPVNLGALAIVAAFILGISVLDGADVEEKTDALFAGFPGDLFVILAGVTFLFAIAKSNGTVDWLVQASIRAVGGRIGLIPWVMFLVTACLTAIGAVVPASVAIISPIGMGFAVRYKINPLLMGLMIINGASAGGFSPISIFGSITNGVVDKAGLPGNPTLLFLASFVFNAAISLVAFFAWGGRDLLGRRAEDDGWTQRVLDAERANAEARRVWRQCDADGLGRRGPEHRPRRRRAGQQHRHQRRGKHRHARASRCGYR